jgi:phosphatidylglycerophosphate synthase
MDRAGDLRRRRHHDYLDGYFARAYAQQSALGAMLDPIADKLLVAACLLMLVADRTIQSLAIWAAIVILCREILVSGLREFLAELKVSVPVSRVAKWKTTVQLVAVGFLIAGPQARPCCPARSGRHRAPVDRRVLTIYTGGTTSRPASITSWTTDGVQDARRASLDGCKRTTSYRAVIRGEIRCR